MLYSLKNIFKTNSFCFNRIVEIQKHSWRSGLRTGTKEEKRLVPYSIKKQIEEIRHPLVETKKEFIILIFLLFSIVFLNYSLPTLLHLPIFSSSPPFLFSNFFCFIFSSWNVGRREFRGRLHKKVFWFDDVLYFIIAKLATLLRM